ncbi:hypothetical protein DFH07DRAFT_829375 [Mycena maculata]|uniref:Uncharacterized protein n=1 Tax=Mycena maculata TaxID=230809 RepID=A0AAD7IV54_9AGAR|nr:hypothetical protein DFH07DRAFT_829375 [Mycena maculata]
MASTLIDLCNLISASVGAVDARCRTLSRTYPDLNNPAHSKESESLLQDHEIGRATAVAVATASQLIASMKYPARSLIDTSLGFLLSAALRVVAESSTAEIIREAGPQGCHIGDIARKNRMDPIKIARLRTFRTWSSTKIPRTQMMNSARR